MSYQSILVALDGSKLAEKALEYLPQIADQGAHLHLLTVVTESHTAELPTLMTSTMNPDFAVAQLATSYLSPESQRHCIEYLECIRDRLRASGYCVSIETTYGDVADTIVTAASHYEVILMATHGRTGIGKLIMGSITEAVLHSANCPVIVVPSHPERLQRFNSSDTPIPIRILVSLNGTPESETILPVVEKLIEGRPAKLILLRVAPAYNTDLSVMEPHIKHALQAENHEDLHDLFGSIGELPMRHYLDQIAASLARPDVKVICEVGFSHPANEIQFFADLYRVDLIAKTTYGRSGLPRLVHGSVTEEVLYHVSCPVVVTRVHQEFSAEAIPASLTSN
jgi:nucleotide-binding universal stress UspA family protein